jgi:hypothetical protein
VRAFVEPEAAAVFSRYRESGALEELHRLLRLLVPVIEAVVCRKLGRISGDFDEIRSYALRKLSRGLARNYDPARGSLFNFTTKTAENALVDRLRRKASWDRCFVPLDAEILARFGVNGADHRHAVAEITYRTMQVRTTVRDGHEREGQRWLVRNLLASGFRFYRHEGANALSVVYGIPSARARRLYDMTLLSIRRALIGERRLRPVDSATLRAHRVKPLLRYRAALSEAEFTRLIYLMRKVAPAIIESGEFTLNDVLYGPPNERPLFSHSEALAAAAVEGGVF